MDASYVQCAEGKWEGRYEWQRKVALLNLRKRALGDCQRGTLHLHVEEKKGREYTQRSENTFSVAGFSLFILFLETLPLRDLHASLCPPFHFP